MKQVHKRYLRNLKKHFKNQVTSSLLPPVLSSAVGSGATKTNKKKMKIKKYIYKQIRNQKSKKLKKQTKALFTTKSFSSS